MFPPVAHKRTFILVCLAALPSAWPAYAQGEAAAISRNSPIVLPDPVRGVSRKTLNGMWEFTATPATEFWKDTATRGWRPIQVPGEPMMQGAMIRHDTEFAYRKMVPIPGNISGKRLILRFNGVYSYARVWVNGRFVRDHHGGFTSWDCDITPMVSPGRTARLVVGVEDRTDEISFGSGYAKHPIGGILRNVELVVLPEYHLCKLNATVRFDSLYRDAALTLDGTINRPSAATLKITLLDPDGKQVTLNHPRMEFSRERATAVTVVPISMPQHWDAEHPRLYTVRASLVRNGKTTEVVTQRIGFREVRVAGTTLLVNGMPVKLRGACRHDIHPAQGRSTTPEQDRLDVHLAKEANINFIRTSHYPPSREFLDFCDEYGIYVEEETAVCFVGTHRHEPYRSKGASQDDSSFTGRYLSQLSEMIERDRNHPAVVIWSIGNENEYGRNFQAEYDFVKLTDRSRPVMFSYPGKVPKDRSCYDIVNIHYVNVDGHAGQYGIEVENFGTPGIPVIHDEWVHVACYNTPTLKSDPNVRNFWGESLKKMWDGCFESEGGVGGAIWGYVDEVFMLPDTVVGYGPWGILDVWRRKKPEFWLTKKAYSPLRVEQTSFPAYRVGEVLPVPIYNRFDHTNLRELQIQVMAGTSTSLLAGPDIPPHTRGTFNLQAGLLSGGAIDVKFLCAGTVIDEEVLTVGKEDRLSTAPTGRLAIEEGEGSILVSGGGFSLTFNTHTGLIEDGRIGVQRIILSGPHLHIASGGGKMDWSTDSLLDPTGGAWKAEKVVVEKGGDELRLSSTGRAGSIDVAFTIAVNGGGEIRTTYMIRQLPKKWREVGVDFLLDPALDSLSWERNALWSVYPNDHIGRPAGSAPKIVSVNQREEYRERPVHPWSWDTKDFFLFGRGSGRPDDQPAVPMDFRATKEQILRYTLTDRRSLCGVEVTSDSALAARAVVHGDGTTTLVVLNQWNYANLSWGNYERTRDLAAPFRGETRMRLKPGTGAR